MTEHVRLPLGQRVRPLWEIVRLSYRRDPWRTSLALVPVFPLLAGTIALSGRDILTLTAHQDSRVIAPALIGGIALVAAAVVGYWQAANGLLRLLQVTSSELDFAILDRLSDTRTIDVYDDPDFVDRLEMLRVGRSPLANSLALLGGLVGLLLGTAVTAGLFAAVDPWLAVPATAGSTRDHGVCAYRSRLGTCRGTGRREPACGPAPVRRRNGAGRGKGAARPRANRGTAGAAHRHLGCRQQRAHRRRPPRPQAAIARLDRLLRRHRCGARRRPHLNRPTHLGSLALPSDDGGDAADGVGLEWGRHRRRTAQRTGSRRPLRTGRRRSSTGETGRTTAPVPEALAGGITLDTVRLRYPGGHTDALGPIDLHLPAGSVTAVVGPNGAGKTTLVNLLLGLRKPTGGSIWIDSQPLDDVDLARVAITNVSGLPGLHTVRAERTGVGHRGRSAAAR